MSGHRGRTGGVLPGAQNLLFLNGATLNVQGFVYDAGGPFDVAATQGLEIPIYQR